jgi:uncharacterized protein (TIGR02246 family)
MSSLREEVDKANKALATGLAEGNAEAMAALYTDNAIIMPPHADLMQSRAAVQQCWQGALDMGCEQVTLDTVELLEYGDCAVEIGQYVLTIRPAEGEPIVDKGKYLVTWKQEDGTWKLDRDIWNTSLPPAGS